MSILLIATATTLGIVILLALLYYFKGRGFTNPALIKRRNATLLLNCATIIFLVATMIEYTGPQLQLMNIWTFMAFYLLREVLFFTSTYVNNHPYHQDKGLMWGLNNVLFFVLVITIFARFVMNIHVDYFAYHDIYDALFVHVHGPHTFASAVYVLLVIFLLINIGYMMYLRYKSYNELSRHIHENEIKILMSSKEKNYWSSEAFMFFFLITFFIPYLPVHLFALVYFVFDILRRTLTYQKLISTLMKTNDSKSEYYLLHEKIEKWLRHDPFPLNSSGWTLEALSDAIEEGRDVVSHYLYDILGVTLSEWISDKKLDYCRHMLKTTEKNISEISLEVGYKNISAFSRAFTRRYGVTPTSFRKTNTNAK